MFDEFRRRRLHAPAAVPARCHRAARVDALVPEPNAILINEGDSTDSLYIVLSGRVRAYASSHEGREVVLSEYGPGEYFGELSLDGGKRSASVKALEACSCCVVQGSETAPVPGRASRLRAAPDAQADRAWCGASPTR